MRITPVFYPRDGSAIAIRAFEDNTDKNHLTRMAHAVFRSGAPHGFAVHVVDPKSVVDGDAILQVLKFFLGAGAAARLIVPLLRGRLSYGV